jgi:predicted O-linked N-acetylglucosamine transferase (SPINDLY family)
MAEVIMRELGLDDLITDTPREFVELACRLGEDRNFRETARMRIKAAMAEPSRIFDMARFGAEANRVLLDLAQ